MRWYVPLPVWVLALLSFPPGYAQAFTRETGHVVVICDSPRRCELASVSTGTIVGPREAVAPEGSQRIVVRSPGCEVLELDVHVAASEVTTVWAMCMPRPARLAVFSSPARAEVFLNGARIGATPLDLVEVLPGPSSLRLELEGHRIDNVELDLSPDSTHAVERELVPYRPKGYVFLPPTRARIGYPESRGFNPERMLKLPGFWISRLETTVEEYRECVRAGHCTPPAEGDDCNWGASGREGHPVNCVSARQAHRYAEWISEREGMPFRLPSVIEYERAARGSTGRAYPWGDDSPGARCNICDRNCADHIGDRSVDDGWRASAPAGSFERCEGPEGIRDLVGNVAEWCVDPEATYQVRGGSYRQPNAFLEASYVYIVDGDRREPWIGFRLVHLPGDAK